MNPALAAWLPYAIPITLAAVGLVLWGLKRADDHYVIPPVRDERRTP